MKALLGSSGGICLKTQSVLESRPEHSSSTLNSYLTRPSRFAHSQGFTFSTLQGLRCLKAFEWKSLESNYSRARKKVEELTSVEPMRDKQNKKNVFGKHFGFLQLKTVQMLFY